MNPTKFDVIVVGGGASGMMAAGRAGERGKRVLLVEKNKNLGEKLKITGGGRCNITNAEFDERIFLRNYGSAAPFLFSPFSQFGVKDTFSFFESKGLPLVTQAGGRTFPQTEKALDVFRVMEQYVEKNGVTIKKGTPVSRVFSRNGYVTGVLAGGVEYTSGAVILSSGGMSHSETGSTGDGFKWLADLGHTVRKPTPTIVPLRVVEEWIKNLAGTTFSPVKITFFLNGTKQFSKNGELLCTHFGVSGPMILNCAGLVGDLLHEGKVTAEIDVVPDVNLGELENRIIAICDANKNKTIRNVLKNIVPKGGITQFLCLADNMDGNIKAHSFTKEQRKLIARTLKSLPLTITGLMGYDKAVVVDGGVTLEEIDTRTMASRLYKNLYVTGDLLDINRPSGGYSLQLCWTTGYVAGTHAEADIELAEVQMPRKI